MATNMASANMAAVGGVGGVGGVGDAGGVRGVGDAGDAGDAGAIGAYRLTRFLYPADEVKYSLITALLKKEDIDECYYWAYELYYSQLECELFELFMRIHWDFYAERNPKLERYIIKKMKKWENDKDMKHIAYIVKNLFMANPTPTVFLMRQYVAAFGYPSHICTGKNIGPQIPESIINFGAEYKNLCSAIDYGRMANIAYHINRLVKRDGSDIVHAVIIDYFETEFGGIIEGGREKISYCWRNRFVLDDVHFLMALVVHLMTEENYINIRPLFGVPRQEYIDEMMEIEMQKIEKIYTTLCYKRKWPTNKIIGSFELARDGLFDFMNDNWLHWEYYASGVPLWSQRIQECSGVTNHEKREIVFPDDDDIDDMEERFYKYYGFELDEQPKEVQNLSLHFIYPLNWKVWLCEVFGLDENGYQVQEDQVQEVFGQQVFGQQVFGQQVFRQQASTQDFINNFQSLVVDDIQILSDKMSKMSIESTNKISLGLDINSIMENMPLNYRFIY